MVSKYVLKHVFGENFAIRAERQLINLGSVRLVTNADSPKHGSYVARFYDSSDLYYASTAQAALDEAVNTRARKREERIEAARAERSALLEKRASQQQPNNRRQYDDDTNFGPIVDIRIPVRNKDHRK